MRVLLIEDDKYVNGALRRGLRNSYIIDASLTAAGGLQLINDNVYDLILLDLNLPDKPGLQVCRELRAEGNATPILILTGLVEIDDKVTLLDSGADDYLTKPFSLEELKARMRALLRRNCRKVGSSTLSIAGVLLDASTRSCRREGKLLKLRRKEFDLLEYLMSNSGKTITRQMMFDRVWDMDENPHTNVIDVHIKYLRDQIDRPFSSSLIKTVHGVGYKFDPAVIKRIRKEIIL